ncbi:MAG: DNA polymerase Y family protein [Desulforhopalus sp.]
MMDCGFRLPERSVLHFNVADFAVAVERVSDCSLRERPLIIAPLQAARAVVYDMSEEAYGEGVRKGMALRQAMRLCRGAELLAPRVPLYRKAMQAFLKELRHYSPLIECGWADGHFFVDVTGTHRLYGPAPDVGWRVRRHARTRLGINPIWTLGTGKVVAKVASRLVKPVGEYIVTPGEEAAFLSPLPVDILPGLAAGELQKMVEFQITTIGSLAELSQHQLMVVFGGRADYLHGVARGEDHSRVGRATCDGQVIDYEHSFANDTNDQRELERAVTTLAHRAGFRLRRYRQTARRVMVHLRYSDGKVAKRQASCPTGTSGDFYLDKLAQTALARARTRRTRVRSCRLTCDRLQRQSPQLLLFPEPEGRQSHRKKIDRALDTLRHRFGHTVIGMGRQYPAARRTAAH